MYFRVERVPPSPQMYSDSILINCRRRIPGHVRFLPGKSDHVTGARTFFFYTQINARRTIHCRERHVISISITLAEFLRKNRKSSLRRPSPTPVSAITKRAKAHRTKTRTRPRNDVRDGTNCVPPSPTIRTYFSDKPFVVNIRTIDRF